MATKTIPWTTGTGNITLSYTGQGDDTVVVTSDQNNLTSSRSQTITFKTTDNSVTRQVTVSQAAMVIPVPIYNGHPTSYDTTDYAWDSSLDISNAYAGSDSTNYATINFTKGGRAETYCYFVFDTSSIPSNATITSVSCSCKCLISTTVNTIQTRQIQLYAGTTAKGTAHTVSRSDVAFDMSCGTWSRSEISNARIRLYGKRSNSQTSSNLYYRFYGATLTVEYT